MLGASVSLQIFPVSVWLRVSVVYLAVVFLVVKSASVRIYWPLSWSLVLIVRPFSDLSRLSLLVPVVFLSVRSSVIILTIRFWISPIPSWIFLILIVFSLSLKVILDIFLLRYLEFLGLSLICLFFLVHFPLCLNSRDNIFCYLFKVFIWILFQINFVFIDPSLRIWNIIMKKSEVFFVFWFNLFVKLLSHNEFMTVLSKSWDLFSWACLWLLFEKWVRECLLDCVPLIRIED